MEVHVLWWFPVHRPLRLGQQLEDLCREILPVRAEVTGADVPEHVGEVPLAIDGRRRGDHGPQAREAAPAGGLGPQPETEHAERGNGSAYPLHVGARIEQRGKQHVARHACGRVDVGGRRPVRHR